jgi:signal transduction histidine kinase
MAKRREGAASRQHAASAAARERRVVFESVLDHLPFCVQLHAMDPAFTVYYRNEKDSERLRLQNPERGAAHDPRLRSLAERVAETRQPGHVEISVLDRTGKPIDWDWSIMPLLDTRGDVNGLISVVENVTSPVVARRGMKSALAQATALVVEVAQLAERDEGTDALLSAASRRLSLRIGADRVVFYEYQRERRILAARGLPPTDEGEGPALPAVLPCDPDKAAIPAQVAFNGRIYRGTVDFRDIDFWDYADVAGLAPKEGTGVILVPWRAGTERLGLVLAQRRPSPDRVGPTEAFTQEDGAVLIAAGHAAGLIWQRKQAERELARRAEEAESLEQAKSHFLRLASHELRGPVGLLNGYVSMLVDDEVPPERRRDVQRILLEAVDRMNLLLGQLIDVTRLQEGRLDLNERQVDVRDLVRNAVDHVLPLVDRGREGDLEVLVPDTPIPAVLDVPRIEMVVQNLLDNAFKYSTAGDQVECRLQAEAGIMRVTVRDEGIGITDEERARLFTRFGRAVNERNSHIRGTGLGLFISREIARMHGGDLSALPVEGRGSRFELVLPVSAVTRHEVIESE